MKKPYRFFLGGHDGEMIAIRELLEAQGYQHGADFFDRELEWGAALKDYEGLFTDMHTHVCIELTEGATPLPPYYIRIDHHNEGSDLPASIEQLADLLGITLTREQQLIAANDRGYIPAMQAMGASPEEIKATRKKDRQAHGVTLADEHQAKQDIANQQLHGDLVVINTQLSKFSHIVDRLPVFSKVLVSNESEVTYFSPKEGSSIFNELKRNDTAQQGGVGNLGYVVIFFNSPYLGKLTF